MPEQLGLEQASVVVGGLGLMGGSLALALRGRCRRLTGWDLDPRVIAHARRMDLMDAVATDPLEVVPQADLIVLAAPVGAILEMLRQMPGWHPGEAMVIDLGSTKAEILRAMDSLPSRFDPIGGHPMCGKETSGLESADRALFHGAAFALAPLARTSERARRLAGDLVRAVGGRPLWVDAETHDTWVAATSHLPFLLAAAAVLSTPEEAGPLVGPGFASTTRLAGSNTRMMLDILRTNRKAVVEAVRRTRREIDSLELLLSGDPEDGLALRLAEAARRRRLLLGVDGGDAS
jgi:prephenate dehydrogenase